MEQRDYKNFDLKIEKRGDQYVARVLFSPAGEASVDFKLPLSDVEFENLILKLGRVRRRSRRIESPEMEAAQQLGGKLFDSIFTGGVLTCFKQSLDEVSRRDEVGLRLRLKLQDVPELADLPWEFLYNTSSDLFLAPSAMTPVIRYIEMQEIIKPLAVDLPLNVLVMISSPSDYACLNVEQEKANLQKALEPLIRYNKICIEYLANASLNSLQRLLRSGHYHVFHFIGHGGFDSRSEQGVLVLEDDSRRGRLTNAQRIGQLLYDHRCLRLVILNACEGARNSKTDPFAGVAATLVRQGIPAVVAMQFEISDDAAITFSTEFYTALAEGLPVDAAVAEARKAIYFEPNDVEWGTPVLYMRSQDGVLFHLPEKPAEKVPTFEPRKIDDDNKIEASPRDARPLKPPPKSPADQPTAVTSAPGEKTPEQAPAVPASPVSASVKKDVRPLETPPKRPKAQPSKKQTVPFPSEEKPPDVRPWWKINVRNSAIAFMGCVLLLITIGFCSKEDDHTKPGSAPVVPSPATRQTSPASAPAPTPSLAPAEQKQAATSQDAENAFKTGERYKEQKNYSEAAKWYRKAAEQGHAPAQNELGDLYYYGRGVTQSDSEALKWFRKAVEQGDALGQKNLGVMYVNGRGVARNDAEAVKWFRKAVEQGLAAAQSELGFMYVQGRGMARNDAEAVKWFRKAAEQGDASGQTWLGFMYENGQGVAQSNTEALKWYRKAVDQGHADAQNRLGLMYQKGRGVAQSDAEAVKWFRKAAEQGDAGAQCNLGFMYQKGRGVAQSDTEALNWFRKAAEQGDASGQTWLGWMYRQGRGVTQSDTEAVNWFRKPADRGHADAQYNLGFMYLNGRGVTQSDTEALNWFRKAANQGDADAQYYLGWMYREGRGVAQSDAEAMNWFRKAADQGNADGQYTLGWMYARGRGVTQSDAEAVKWLRKAADQGNAHAQSELGFMYQKGRGFSQSDAEAVKWFRKAADQGLATAQGWLGLMYEEGRGVARSDAEAVNWYRKAAKQGHKYSQEQLKKRGLSW